MDVSGTGILDLLRSAPSRYPELAGKVAIVTGSTKKIGRGIAARLAAERMKIVLSSRSREDVEAVRDDLLAEGVEAIGVEADMSEPQEIDRMVRAALDAWGAVHLLVNNAANVKRQAFFDVTEELLKAHVSTNIEGPYIASLFAARSMRETGGSIINISSVGGLRAHWKGLPYDVTKGALDAMTRAMALELAHYGIRVNAIAPGAIRSEDRSSDESVLREVAARIPLGRHGFPLEIGAAVAFLASNDASYITGQVVYVDGGITAQLYPPGQTI